MFECQDKRLHNITKMVDVCLTITAVVLKLKICWLTIKIFTEQKKNNTDVDNRNHQIVYSTYTNVSILN